MENFPANSEKNLDLPAKMATLIPRSNTGIIIVNAV